MTEKNRRLFDLSGKKAIVTGAASGINKEIALNLCLANAMVAIADINYDQAKQVSQEFNNYGYKTIAIEVDVSKKEAVKQMVRKTINTFGGLDIAVNGAGVIGTRLPSSENIKEDDLKQLFKIMLFGVFFCCQEEAKIMINQKYGRIINIASMSGVIINRGIIGIAPYAAIKAGVIHMSKALASEWVESNITVNAISPGYTRTPANSSVYDIPERNETYMKQIPMQRFAKPSDIAGAAVFLASEEANYITGQNIIVDGGVTIW